MFRYTGLTESYESLRVRNQRFKTVLKVLRFTMAAKKNGSGAHGVHAFYHEVPYQMYA